jgi:hypothetical protein
MGEPLAAGQIRVFPGHVYELEESHAH